MPSSNSVTRMSDLDLGTPSTSGAFNGTAISIIEPGEIDGLYHLFYQRYDGRLKHLVSPNPRVANWTESSDSKTLVSNARNRTPLVAIADSVIIPETKTHLFYVDVSNHIRQFILDNGSRQWQPSPLRLDNITTSDSLVIALDVSFSGRNFDLYYGSDDGLVHELKHGSMDDYAFTGSSSNQGVAFRRHAGGKQLFTVDKETSQIQLWERDWVQGANIINVTTNANTPLFTFGDNVYFVDADAHVVKKSARLPLPAQVEAASQVGAIGSKNVVYIQLSGDDISAFGLNEDGSYTPAPRPV